jgi:penicillin-binding protein 1A
MGARRRGVRLVKKRKKRLNPWRLLLLLLLVALITASGATLSLLAISVKDLPAWDENKLYSIAASSYYDQNGELFARIGEENREPVKIKDIPLFVQDAFIAVEDVRFYHHHGVDLRGIARAVWNNLTGGGIQQGASTITQQLVKLSFLTPEKTLKRKIQEAILAFMVERRYSKQEILEMYLNKIYFGNGAYGIQAASRIYFGKKVNELSLSQAAFLAGLPKAPNLYSKIEEATARRNVVLDTMARYGFISEAQIAEAKKEPLIDLDKNSKGTLYPYPYFVDHVTKQLISDFGEDMIYKGGLRVYTTLDRNTQKAAEDALANPKNFPVSGRDSSGILQPEGAAVFLDPQTGYIKAIAGGREHTHQLQFNRATMAPRQPGSAFKPIVAYGPAIELKGMGPASVIDDIPVKYGSYSPPNYDKSYRGLTTMRTALRHSVNVVAVRTMMEHAGISNAVNFARRLGITLDPQKHGASMALGGLNQGVTPLQMAVAYAAFANGGIYVKPTAVLRVESLDGKVLKEYKAEPYQALKPSTAYLITDMLKDVIQSGTGTNARLNRPAAGKTGTTDEGKDLWFAGYTPDLVGVVWIGHDKPKSMPFEYGGRYPAFIWRQVMNQALKNIPPHDFPRPANIVSATVDNKSGLLPGPNTPAEDMITDLFAAGTVPAEVDNTHVLVEVCATTGLLAGEYCPDRVTRVMIRLPYSVPEFVADYQLRVPAEICTLHNLGNLNLLDRTGIPVQSIVPGKPENKNGPYRPEKTTGTNHDKKANRNQA